MNSSRRRRLLQALGGIGAGGLAGCTGGDSTPGSSTTASGTTGAGAGSTTATGTQQSTTRPPTDTATTLPPLEGPPENFRWFGPDVVGATWVTQNQSPDEIPSEAGVGTYGATHPGRMDAAVLGEEYVVEQRAGLGGTVWGPPVDLTVPGESIDAAVHGNTDPFRLYSGDFDVAALRSSLATDPVRSEPVADGAVHVVPDPEDDEAPYVGVAITGSHIAIVAVPDEAHAVVLPRAFVGTRTGERPRYTDTDEIASRVAEHLPRAFDYRGTWQPYREETILGETTVSGPNVTAYRVADGEIRHTFVTWLPDEERGTAAEREASLSEDPLYDDVSVTDDGALQVVRARLTVYPTY